MSSYEEQIDPQRLLAVMVKGMAASDSALNVYWYEVGGDRDEYAKELRNEIGGEPIVPLIVRDAMFDNPNAVLSELIQLIGRNRSLFEERLVGTSARPARIGIVLLTRTTLGLPQIPSPVTLPDWFPHLGSMTVSVLIQDVTWTGAAPLNAAEAAIPSLCRQLFELDGALLRRVTAVRQAEPTECDSLWSRLSEGKGSLAEFIKASEEFRAEKRDASMASNFRPDATSGNTLVALIWRIMQHTAPEKVRPLADAFARALMLPASFDLPWYQSIMAVLGRPANRSPDQPSAFAGNLLRTVAFSSQLITVAAHADAYADYPVPLMRTLSYDLRRSLAEARAVISSLESL